LYGTTIHTLIDPAQQTPESIVALLNGQGHFPRNLAEIEPRLEDVFVSLYNGFAISPDGRHIQVEPRILRTIPLFEPLDEVQLSVIANRFLTERVPAGQDVFRTGDPGDRLYIVARGRLDAFREASGGGEQQVARFEDGDFFGEIALLRHVERTATVRTRSPALLLSLTRDQFSDLVNETPALRPYIERVVASRLAQIQAEHSDVPLGVS
jgi:ATP-binding cassette subfamily B protein